MSTLPATLLPIGWTSYEAFYAFPTASAMSPVEEVDEDAALDAVLAEDAAFQQAMWTRLEEADQRRASAPPVERIAEKLSLQMPTQSMSLMERIALAQSKMSVPVASSSTAVVEAERPLSLAERLAQKQAATPATKTLSLMERLAALKV